MRLNESNHKKADDTFAEYCIKREDIGKHPNHMSPDDWRKITPPQMNRISKRMIDATDLPEAVKIEAIKEMRMMHNGWLSKATVRKACPL